MSLWSELLSDDVGLLSLITILVATLIVVVCVAIFVRRAMKADKESCIEDRSPKPGA
ncbi:DUF3149 domain-containing protein [Paludibacterium paludis]|uniref:DUF3149 domain-containing protein n=1 Tax=Paludibacterium paludis TaxID=1225769 RepID=A0A918NZF6_9NEIS|nr:DUF3149 domain-containing protein [Paludibacterium paludis]GGY07927.1 hypothetical protein GCM10011289_08130 [Paludibacterium paludis]